jgi:hypothetical protein
MKSEFEARPVYVQRDDRIMAHINMTLLSQSSGYVPSYKRTDLIDELHRAFGFRTDYEYLSKVEMKNIVKESKEIKRDKK